MKRVCVGLVPADSRESARPACQSFNFLPKQILPGTTDIASATVTGEAKKILNMTIESQFIPSTSNEGRVAEARTGPRSQGRTDDRMNEGFVLATSGHHPDPRRFPSFDSLARGRDLYDPRIEPRDTLARHPNPGEQRGFDKSNLRIG